ncbi:helix-turn-helix transcriptional regulator [Billgrantia endophytica]|uniref:AraC family transcriptional regulator n=1 Tax=Billgrantia endophytica TaxID=2033802 RepID=A0A2N7U7Y1_9GAMM|nr:AraC family transcriptional regulator [Halomonas endophytica]PMR76523.1 AraC family transcriptional regulator [Halomonas endophytica]
MVAQLQHASPCRSEYLALDDGLAVNWLRYHPTRELVEESRDPHGRPMLVLTFGLQGESCFVERQGERVAFRAGYTTITAFATSHGERRYPEGQVVAQLRLLIGEERLRQYAGEAQVAALMGSGTLRRLAFMSTFGSSQAHVRALAGYFRHDRHKLNMQIHALSALSHALDGLLPRPTPTAMPKLNDEDIERLERARDILLARMDRPLTLAYLCAEVGMNEFSFKRGFRRLFGTTPQRLLHEYRMHHAHALLESGCQVAQTAYRVGYAYPGNFSAAFSRFFGRAPKSVFGKRR